jgi:glycosyltransferase involved in cell wall biosynthesis
MRVAILAQPNDVVPSGGSLAIWAMEVASRLSKQHDVTVYSRWWEGANNSPEDLFRHVRLKKRLDDAVTGRLRTLENGLGRVFGRPVDYYYRHYYYRDFFALDYVLGAARQIREREEDAVVVINFSQSLPLLRRLCPRTRLALIMQCDWLVELPSNTVERRLQAADLVMGCSNYIRDGVRGRFPSLSAPIETLYNGSSPETLTRDLRGEHDETLALKESNEKVVLFVGRVTPEKGVHLLIRAMKQVLARIPEAVLIIAGAVAPNPPSPRVYGASGGLEVEFEKQKPDYWEHLHSLAAPFGDRVRFLSGVPHGELGPWYEVADVFVHPAVWQEPFGMILTEAMAFSCPVVSTYSGGVPEIVLHEKTGLLVERDDSNALAGAITELLENPDRARAMGQAGRERLEQEFGWDRTASRLSELLMRLDNP